jgi:hypothetical protein
MNELLDDIQIGDWLAIVSTMKGSSQPVLQQVTSTTSGLVWTRNYTFRRDGRSFSVKQKSLTARPATASEIEARLSGRKKQDIPTEEIILGRYLASVSADEWAKLGVAQLRKVKAALGNNAGASSDGAIAKSTGLLASRDVKDKRRK